MALDVSDKPSEVSIEDVSSRGAAAPSRGCGALLEATKGEQVT